MTGPATSPPDPLRPAGGSPDCVELSFPLRPDLVFLARMTAAAVATRAGFGFDQVEDLRLAIDELCTSVAGEAEGDDQLHLLFEWSQDAIRVEGTLRGGVHLVEEPASRSATPTPRELSERILDALVDEHGTESADGPPRVWMVVRRRDDTA